MSELVTLPTVDVLIVGSGLAGCAAAWEALAAGARVAICSAGGGSSIRAQGGIAGAIGPGDSPALHAADTIVVGAGACDLPAVATFTSEAPMAIEWLQSRGVRFDPEGHGEQPALALEAAHSQPRVLHAGGDATGLGIMSALWPALIEQAHGRLAFYGRSYLERLDGEDRCVGALLRCRGRVCYLPAAATVLATGGYAGLYRPTTNDPATRGKGILEAWRLGAVLVDLEFVQFHPTVFAGAGEPFLVSEALRGAGAYIVDAGGRRFLFDTDPRGELAPRSVVSRAIAEHLRHTGAQTVFLSVHHLGAERLEQSFPGFLTRCRRAGLNPLTGLVPVGPAAHYSIGGIATNLAGKTAVPGLLAAGECACTGMHGADRLASNSLLEAVVLGRRAGAAAAATAASTAQWRPSKIETGGRAGARAHRTAEALGRLLNQSAGILRDGTGLNTALDLLGREGDSPSAADGVELARLICISALARQESRGSHFRTDFPQTNVEWGHLHLEARRSLSPVDIVATVGPRGPVVRAHSLKPAVADRTGL